MKTTYRLAAQRRVQRLTKAALEELETELVAEQKRQESKEAESKVLEKLAEAQEDS